MSDKPKYKTREEWLNAAVELMRPLFKSAGYTIPTIRVACGWPSSGGLSPSKRCLGQAWAKAASKDNIAQLFISPWLDEPSEVQGVLATLVHEVVHATVGNAEGHNKVFGKCARAVGLEGKLTATIAGEVLIKTFGQWMKSLGPYPHSRLDRLKAPTKKQTTRMIKCECGQCGYVARVTRKWLEEAGAPGCPQHGPMKYKVPEELEDDSEGGGE